jgi:FtsP/CotA-like multicopper oxidase with cupredoxin domain
VRPARPENLSLREALLTVCRPAGVENGGGLLPRPLLQNKIELWPAMRRGFVVDFGHYMDGRATTRGEVIYLVNTCKMPDGRMPTSPDPAYKVPLIKFIIDGDPAPEDQDHSLPIEDQATHRDLLNQPLRPQPEVLLPDGHSYPVAALFDSKGSPIPALKQMIDTGRQFTLERGGQTSLPPPNEPNDNEWSINGTAFDETRNARDHKGRETKPRQGVPEVWTVINGGGGWVHPMHMHQEEHKILLRNGKPAATWQQPVTDPRHADDIGKDDVVLLDPSEKVVFYRNFRTFRGKYVAHCHNLAHEDHSMMFGWEIQ